MQALKVSTVCSCFQSNKVSLTLSNTVCTKFKWLQSNSEYIYQLQLLLSQACRETTVYGIAVNIPNLTGKWISKTFRRENTSDVVITTQRFMAEGLTAGRSPSRFHSHFRKAGWSLNLNDLQYSSPPSVKHTKSFYTLHNHECPFQSCMNQLQQSTSY